jgi:hypothetical protein
MTSSTPTAPISADQKKAAREAKAAQERARRAAISAAKETVEKAGIFVRMNGSKIVVQPRGEDDSPAGEEVTLDAEQRDRAATAKQTHGGLSGKALATFILTGASGREQVQAARQQAAVRERQDRSRANVTRSADPAATEVSQKAKEFAGVKSAFLPKEGRQFLDGFTVTVNGSDVSVRRGDTQGVEGALEEAVLAGDALRAFAKGEDLDADAKKEVRVKLTGLGKGTVLWGRKLAAFIAVKAADAS